MLQRCEEVAAPAGMTLWGVDQEFMGSTGFLLDKNLATNPGPESKAAMQALLIENAEAHAAAAKSGNRWDLLMT